MTCQILTTLEESGLTRLPDDWEEQLTSVTPDQVEQALKPSMAPFTLQRLKTLIAPAAAAYLEPMARASAAVTRQRFGNTMGLYAPLYLSNHCINRCRYCGFNAEHGGERCRLSLEEAVAEANIIAAEGFGDILLVAGEDPGHINVDYLCELARALRNTFSSIAVEIYTLEENQYRALFEAGIEGVTLYQETYDRQVYANYHLGGPKADYEARLAAQESCAKAGMRRLGIGALLGLQDWRFETMALGAHAHTLIRRYWRSRVSISFPRMRPAPEVEEEFPHLVSDTDLVQMMLALRLCFPDVGLVLSTRESAEFRNNVLPLAITQMSAGSKTNPKGYSEDSTTEQFTVADNRPVAEVAAYLRNRSFDPVWKDWDTGFQAGT